MLCFSCITPHPVVATPTIEKKMSEKIKNTIKSLKVLEEDLYISKPDIILLFSSSEDLKEDEFLINVSPTFKTDLKEFGDLVTQKEYKGDISLPNKIYETCLQKDLKVKLFTKEKLAYNFSIPLVYLTNHLSDVKILPITTSTQSYKKHVKLGEVIKEIILATNKRVAVVVSGDLSHALTSDSPAGFNKSGENFDNKIQELLNQKSLSGMLQLNEKNINDANETIFRQLLVMMGIMLNINYDYKSYCYEAPYGVGHLTANLKI